MKKITFALLATAATLSACSTTSERRVPASIEPSSQTVELASKLKGGTLKFKASREGNEVSVLGFLDLKFSDCQALVNAEENNSAARGIELGESFVSCAIKMNSGPISTNIETAIKGDKRNFSIRGYTGKPEEYELEVVINMTWENRRWKAKGNVTGWVRKHVGDDVDFTATVKETLSF